MNRYDHTIPLRPSPRGIASRVAALAFAAAFAGATHAAIALSTFDTGTDGWVGVACPNPGICAAGVIVLLPGNFDHVATGGNPGGYIDLVDPGSDTAGRAVAPAAFLDNLAMGLTLSFDVLVTDPDGTGEFDATIAPLVAIEGPGGLTLVYGSTDLPPEGGPWKHYDVPLSLTAAWQAYDGVLRPATAGDFAAVFGAPTRLTLIAEWLNDEADLDTGGLDNVALVPIPAALALLLAPLAVLGGVRRAARQR
jgi:hypothetical protein